MAITEESRHKLYQRLEEVLGHEQAAVLMEHLPPLGWADVATKRDVDSLKRDVDALESSLGLRTENLGNVLRAEWRRDLLSQTFALIAANATMVGLAVAVTKLV